MKIPKLKYWYLAMAPGNYEDFAVSRRIDITPQATIDVATGRITGQSQVLLCDSVTGADDLLRRQHAVPGSVYVLRIPSTCIDKSAVEPVSPGVWQYRKSLVIPHCGVERVDQA